MIHDKTLKQIMWVFEMFPVSNQSTLDEFYVSCKSNFSPPVRLLE